MDGSPEGTFEARSSKPRNVLETEETTYPEIEFTNVHNMFSGHEAMQPYDFVWAENDEDRYPEKDPAKYTEFEKRYPPDRFGDELSDNARVWRLLRDRVTELDDDLIRGWDDTLSTLLVFAGLFSAAMTAFLVEFSKRLEPDFTEYTNRAVLAIVAHLNATAMGSMDDLQPERYHAPPLARAVNAVWFISLTLALAVSLISILVKQWLVEFNARMRKPVASARVWAQRHAIYRTAFDTWHLGAMVSALSFLLHISLLLFLAGLIGMLFDIDSISFGIVLGLTSLLTLFYGAATFMPLIYGDCPSYTPLLGQVWVFLKSIYKFVRLARRGFRTCVQMSWEPEPPPEGDGLPPYDSTLLTASRSVKNDGDILIWMVSNLHTKDEVEVAVAAIGVLSMQYNSACYDTAVFSQLTTQPREAIRHPNSEEFFLQAARALRTCITTPAGSMVNDIFGTYIFDQLLRCSFNDVSLLAQLLVAIQEHSEHFRSLPQITFEAIESELDRWSARFPGQLPARITTLQLLLEVPRIMYYRSDEPDRKLYWDISCAVALQLAISIEDQHSATSENAQLARHFAQLVLSESSRDHSLLPKDAHGCVYLLMAWSVLLDLPGRLGVSEDRITAINRCYISQIVMISFRPSVYATQAELLLGHLRVALKPGADNLIIREWSIHALIGAFTILEQRLYVSPKWWSFEAGAILFNIAVWMAEHCTEADRRHQAAQSFGKLLNAANQETLPHRDMIRELKEVSSVESLIRETFLNVLARRSCNENQQHSIWRLAIQSGVEPDRLSGIAARLSIQLAILTKIGHDVTALAEELVADDHGVPLIRASALYGFEMTLHLRTVLPNWWSRAKEVILASPEATWTDGEPVAFVSAVEAEADTCRECKASAALARNHLRKQQAASCPRSLARFLKNIGSASSRRVSGVAEEELEKGQGEPDFEIREQW